MDNMLDDHPSLEASLEDFEEQQNRSPLFDLPSQHSGFRSESSDVDADIQSSTGEPWSPPGFRPHNNNIPPSTTVRGGWFNHQPLGQRGLDLRPSVSASRSRETSPQYEDALEGGGGVGMDVDVTIPANIPLPKGTDSPWKEQSPEPVPVERDIFGGAEDQGAAEPSISNYIRFAIRAEVQHREPIEAVVSWLRGKFDKMTQTPLSTILSITVALLSLATLRALFTPLPPPPVPDLVRVAELARSFEPLIYYSESGIQQISAMQETSVAVWDLSETVGSTNMTSGPVIVNSLDDLSNSLKTLGLELTRFFASVDSDVDSILIVMDWARRELLALQSQESSSLGSIFDGFHALLVRIPGVVEDKATGMPTLFGRMITGLFGSTTPQRTRSTLMRTFTEFLSVLEDSINSELSHSANLVLLFNSLENQFTNLHRAVARENDTQERRYDDFLSSLWTRLLGPNVSLLRKYEKNRKLLADVRSRTIANKRLLLDHERKLHNLKESLELLRRRLVSPLVRRNDSLYGVDGIGSMEVVVEDQMRGLEGTYDYLKGLRERQKSKMMEMVYGSGSHKSYLVAEEGGREIEDR